MLLKSHWAFFSSETWPTLIAHEASIYMNLLCAFKLRRVFGYAYTPDINSCCTFVNKMPLHLTLWFSASLALSKSLFLSLFYFFVQAKVHPYWPQKASSKVERFIIELNSELTFGDYIVRELKLTNTEVQMNCNFNLFLQYFYF